MRQLRTGGSRRERGFSLVEVMIASMVLTVGALGLLRLFISSAQGISVSERMTYATVLARQKLDELNRQSYDSLVSGQEATNLGFEGEPQGAFGSAQANDGWYARSWTVTIPDGAVPFKSVQVDVRWANKVSRRESRVTVVGGKSQQ